MNYTRFIIQPQAGESDAPVRSHNADPHRLHPLHRQPRERALRIRLRPGRRPLPDAVPVPEDSHPTHHPLLPRPRRGYSHRGPSPRRMEEGRVSHGLGRRRDAHRGMASGQPRSRVPQAVHRGHHHPVRPRLPYGAQERLREREGRHRRCRVPGGAPLLYPALP